MFEETGWEFRRSDTIVWIGVQDRNAALEIARKELGGDPDEEIKAVPASVIDFFGIRNGGVIRGRVINRGKM